MDTQPPRPTRRQVLASVAGIALAGCGGSDGAATTAPPTETDAATPTTTATTAGDRATATDGGTRATDTETTAATTTMTAELDLSEANVTGVDVEHRGGTEYRFSVTLHHDDDGEAGYANWWQVESLAGERLGRRKLLHAHGTREFTRSATVDVGEAPRVAVRGHDQTHGYGGRAAVVEPESGETEAVRQGSEPQSLADR